MNLQQQIVVPNVDERDLTVEQWKDLIYREVVDYELNQAKL